MYFRGSAIAKIVGANAVKYNNIFETRVTMYVYEEIVNSQKLTDIINQLHENVKYLPGHKLPENIVSFISFKSVYHFLSVSTLLTFLSFNFQIIAVIFMLSVSYVSINFSLFSLNNFNKKFYEELEFDK